MTCPWWKSPVERAGGRRATRSRRRWPRLQQERFWPVHSRTATTRCQKRCCLPKSRPKFSAVPGRALGCAGSRAGPGRAGRRQRPHHGWSLCERNTGWGNHKLTTSESTGPLTSLPVTLNMQNHKSEIRELTAGTALLLDNLTSPNTKSNGFFLWYAWKFSWP